MGLLHTAPDSLDVCLLQTVSPNDPKLEQQVPQHSNVYHAQALVGLSIDQPQVLPVVYWGAGYRIVLSACLICLPFLLRGLLTIQNKRWVSVSYCIWMPGMGDA